MRFLYRTLRNDITLWPRDPQPDANGQPTWGAPTGIKGRWNDKAVEYLSKDGTKRVSRSVVLSQSPLRVGDIIQLAKFDPDTASVDPKGSGVVEAWEIQSVGKADQLYGKWTVYTAML